MGQIDITVLVITYNHGKYLKDCLDGIYNQKTKYSYQVVIHDDASPDNTQDIILEYRNKYPNKTKVVLQKENKYSQHKPLFNYYSKYINGRYIATCEGDDYWTDPNKLQKQIDFLENNQDYVACYHNVRVVDEYGNERGPDNRVYHYMEEQEFSQQNIENYKLPSQTASKVYRNIWEELDKSLIKDYLACSGTGDQKIVLLLSLLGKIYILEDYMAVHRKILSGGTSWSANNKGKNRSIDKYKSFLDFYKFSEKHFGYGIPPIKLRYNVISTSFLIMLKTRNKKDLRIFIKLLKISEEPLYKILFYIIFIKILGYPFRFRLRKNNRKVISDL